MKNFCSILFTLIAINLFANDIRFNSFGTKDGLSNESSYKLIQDVEGYIWIGTYDGLNRFDGNYFKSYKSDIKDSTSISGNMIMDLMIDNKENLWVATNQGVCTYNKFLDRFEKKVKVGNLDKAYTKSFIQDHLGNYWFASGKFIYEVSPDFKLNQILNQDLDENWIGNTSILCILEDPEGTIWITTQEKGIFSYHPVSKEKKSYSDVVLTNEVFSARNDSYGNIWFGTHEDPYVYVIKDKKFYNLFSPESPFNIPHFLISSVTDDKNGFLWISNWGDGLTRYNIRENTYVNFKNDKNDKTTINGGSIEYSHIDKEGNVWTVGQASGLNVIYKSSRAFNFVKDLNESGAGIFSSPTTAISHDREGNLWFGTDGGGLSRWNKSANVFTNYRDNPNNPKAYGGTSVLTIFVDSKDNLWAGGYNSGLNLFKRETEDFIVFKSDNPPPFDISGKDIRYITEDKSGRIWVATNGGGINIYDPETYNREVINATQNGITSDYCLALMIDDKGRVFIATYNGLSIYNPVDNSVNNFTEDKFSPDSLPTNWVYCLYQDSKGRYWIGTQLGLSLFNDSTKTFKTYLEDQGLTNNTVMSITEDDNGILWISSYNGISAFSPEKEEFQNYNLDDGLPDNQFRMGSSTKTENGQIFFGSNNGVLYFDPEEITKNTIIPIVHFTNLYINNKLVNPGSSKILKQNIDYSSKIKLKHKENFLRIDFIALSYFQANKNKYKYMLEGVDEDWVDCGYLTYASYTNLRHGNYNFLVKAYNNDGVPSEVRSLKIRIRPAWYNTLVFYLLLLISIVYGLYKYITNREAQSKHDKEILEKKISEGEKVIKEKIQLLEKQQKEIIEKELSEKEIKYHYEGIARFSDIINRNRKDIKELSNSLISELVNYVGASTGVVYITDDSDPSSIIIRSFGESSFDSDHEIKAVFEPGEGYVGTCYRELKTIEIPDLPEGYIVLRSGLGQISLKYCILVPAVQEKKCLAVIEMASLEKLPKYKLNFIEKIAESFSTVIAILKANEKTNEMLEQNIVQSEKLKEQEEEMRQNIEEMQATQEDLNRQIEAADKAKKELAKEKILVDSLLKSAKEKIYFKDIESRFIKVSNSMLEAFKVDSEEDLYGKNDFDFFTEEHARPAFNDEMEIIKTGIPIIDKVERETHADGRVTYVSTTKMPLRDENGKAIGTFGISKDITANYEMENEIKQRNEELLAQEEELRQNLEEMHSIQENLQNQISENAKTQEKLEFENIMFTTLMDNITARITYKDKEARYIRINKTKSDALGLKDQIEVFGKTDLDVFAGNHTKERHDKEVEQIHAGALILHNEEFYRQKNGAIGWGETNRIPLKNKAGEIVGGLVITWDITDKKNMQFQLEQSNYLLKSFSDKLPLLIFKTDAKSKFIEIQGNGLKLLDLKNEKIAPEKLSNLFPEIMEIVKNEKSKDVEEISGKIKINKSDISYKTLLIKNDTTIGGYSGYILFEEL